MLGPRATDTILARLGARFGVYRVGLRCPLLDRRTGDACNGQRASVDGNGKFTCPKCRACLGPLELVMRARNLSRAAAAAWLQEQVAADEKISAPKVPVDGARVGRLWDLGRTKKKT